MARKAPSTANGKASSLPAAPGNSAYPAPVDRLLTEFARLPGIGRRSAERLAFHVLKTPPDEALRLADAIRDVKTNVSHCRACFNFASEELCAICADQRRDHSLVLVVEQPRDLIALEQTGMHRGIYHVLMGRLSPLDGVGPEHLTIHDLFKRIDQPSDDSTRIIEVILGLNPNLEGDGTALYLTQELKKRHVKVSRLARGLPSGGQLEFASKAVLADAIEGRQRL
ncbi:MAG TPA: recombination mediator RecR [Phycisphaerales bacterium]|nr:recombination mediator RecR [Phycisphaerales bacterium]